MKRLSLIFAISLAATGPSFAAGQVTATWNTTGVATSQSNVVLDNYPVSIGDGSADGAWVLNSSAPSYAKTSTTWITSGNGKTLQLGSSGVSPVGTTLTLAQENNPIPAGSTINAVTMLMKSVNTESTWSVSVNGVKSENMMTSPQATTMADCSELTFSGINLPGNSVTLTFESLEVAKRYVYIAAISVTYTPGASVPEKVDTPVFSPASGAAIESGSDVAVSTATPGATLMCAVGNGDFTAAADGLVTVTGDEGSTVTVRAYATKEGMTDSNTATATYTISRRPLTPPYTETFDNAETLAGYTIIDAAGDRSTWKYNTSDNAPFIEHQIGNGAKDDWLITPALSLKGGHSYTLRFDVRAGNPDYPETIAVALGNSPEASAMTTVVLPPTEVKQADYTTLTCNVEPTADGTCYIGFHAVSAAGMFRLYVDNIRLSAGSDAAAPGNVSDVSIANDCNGLNQAVISFTTPARAINGNMLTALSSATVTRDGSIIKVFDNPRPATPLSFTDMTDAPGTRTYTIYCTNNAGAGRPTETKAYVGLNIPCGPTDATLSEPEYGKVAIAWTAPETTVAGDRINPDLISYTITDNRGDTIASGIRETTYTYQAVPQGEQTLTGYTVTAATAAGSNTSQKATTALIAAGTPYAMPYCESFPKWHPAHLAEYITPDNSRGLWRVMREVLVSGMLAFDADDGLLVFEPKTAADVASFRSGKIHIDADAANPMLSFRLINLTGSGNSLTVTVDNGSKSASTVIDTCHDNWAEQLIPLSDFAGTDIRFTMTATAGSSAIATAVDLIRILPIGHDDLAIARFRVPSEMDLLLPHSVSVDVVNNGLNQARDFNVALKSGDETVATRTVASLDRNGLATVTFPVTPADPGTVSFRAEILFDADEIPADNISPEKTVSVIAPFYAPVRNLTAAVDRDNVTLSWSRPSESDNDNPVTETFERYDEFAINRAGDWTFYDLDGLPTYGINNGTHSFPNMALPMAYIVFNSTIASIDTIGTMTFDAHGGDQFLASFSVQYGEAVNNDWLVSPLLNGKAQTVSFFARSVAIGTHESFEFLYSTTDNTPSCFVKAGEGEEYSGRWTEFSYNIPEGARYFAIRCVSDDKYAFFVDDITYTPAPSEIRNITGYDIFRDGVKINDLPVGSTQFTDSAVPDGNHSYSVVAVMPRGCSRETSVSVVLADVPDLTAPASAIVKTENGCIVIVPAHEVSVAIYRPDGSMVYHNPSSAGDTVTVTPGLYFVDIGGTTVKVAVR